jgi:hypothetical protein
MQGQKMEIKISRTLLLTPARWPLYVVERTAKLGDLSQPFVRLRLNLAHVGLSSKWHMTDTEFCDSFPPPVNI